MFLREIRAPLSSLKGVGPAGEAAFGALGIESIADLLLHLPRDYEDHKTVVPIDQGLTGTPVNTTATVIAHDWFGFGKKRTLKVWVEDETGRGALNCFGRGFLKEKLPVGATIRLYGSFSYRFGEIQASSFEFEPIDTPPGGSGFGLLLPIYPASASLTQRMIRHSVRLALQLYGGKIEDELPNELKKSPEGSNSKNELLRTIHLPDSREAAAAARDELAWEELLYLQLVIARRGVTVRTSVRHRAGPLENRSQTVIDALPFSLTPDQAKVLAEIRADLKRARPMGRLIQGDVGSGKTLVAFLSACDAVAAGEQAAFMAPTELLARQHADNADRLLKPAGIRIALLTGSLTPRARAGLLDRLKGGEIDLLIGTHALFSPDVEFEQLGLVIIDEQQRFGVVQRSALGQKGRMPDILVMTATPIPRTLAMTLFGDLDISTIFTMPPGRQPISTHLARLGREEKVYDWVRTEIQAGRQAYFVYPLVAESSKMALKDAEGMFARLKQRFPGFRLGLIHSRLEEELKQSTMHAFAAGKIDILVATSVVEVGVDVANASCMVVEHAERFGLAALHQLRGRVGRGPHKSYLFLVYSPELTEAGKLRLKVLKEHADGFTVAEEDLKIRGPGNISGVEQAGFLKLTFADLVRDAGLMLEARDRARRIIADDPGLLAPSHTLIRRVLQRTRPFEEGPIEGG